MIVLANSLSDDERVLLASCEARINDGIEAVFTIREQRLYRERYPSFEAYVQNRWGWSGRRGHQLAAAHGVVLALKSHFDDADVPIPSTEYALRPLAGVEPAQAAAIYEKALEVTQGAMPTHDVIAQVKAQVLSESQKARDYAYQQMLTSEFQYLVDRLSRENALTMLAIADTLRMSHPIVREYMVKIQKLDAAFIRKFNESFVGGSDTAQEIIKTGYLQFTDGSAIAASAATARQLADLLRERQHEHRKQAQSASEGLPVSVVVFNGDAERTFAELKRVLNEDTLMRLAELIKGGE